MSEPPPYGFRRVADGRHPLYEGVRRCGPGCTGCIFLTVDPAEFAVMQRARGLSDQGRSSAQIAAELERGGVTGRSAKPLSATEIEAMVVGMRDVSIPDLEEIFLE
jgi:hypothetical protein